jgi:hypothetical protein
MHHSPVLNSTYTLPSASAMYKCIRLLSRKFAEFTHRIQWNSASSSRRSNLTVYPAWMSLFFRVERLLQYITISLLRTRAFSLLQYNPFIPSTPKRCVFRIFLFSCLNLVTNYEHLELAGLLYPATFDYATMHKPNSVAILTMHVLFLCSWNPSFWL